MMDATHWGPIGGMIVICVEPGTEIRGEDGSLQVVDDRHTVVSGKGALYVTPTIFALLKNRTEPKRESATPGATRGENAP